MAAAEAIGLSGQMLAALVLGADHRPLWPAMLWNDQRAVAEYAELPMRCPNIGPRTNGTPDPSITAPKLLWLGRHEPRVIRKWRMLILTKDCVRLALTGELSTEPTDADGTQLMDCRSGQWDAELCAEAGWNPDHLPPVTMPWAVAGTLRPALDRRLKLHAGLPVAARSGDNMGAMLGAGRARPGDTMLSIGTSGVACVVDAAFHPGPDFGILTSAHAAADTFLSMGEVMSATASLDWTACLGGAPRPGLWRAAAATGGRFGCDVWPARWTRRLNCPKGPKMLPPAVPRFWHWWPLMRRSTRSARPCQRAGSSCRMRIFRPILEHARCGSTR